MRGSSTSTPSGCSARCPGGTAAPALEAPTLQPTAHDDGRAADDRPLEDAVGALGDSVWSSPPSSPRPPIYEWMRPAGESPVAHNRMSRDRAAPRPRPHRRRECRGDVAAQSAASDAPAADVRRRPHSARPQSSAAPACDRRVCAGGDRHCAGRARRASVGEQTVIVAFRKSAWTEIRDRDGRVLLTGTQPARHRRRPCQGAPPLVAS